MSNKRGANIHKSKKSANLLKFPGPLCAEEIKSSKKEAGFGIFCRNQPPAQAAEAVPAVDKRGKRFYNSDENKNATVTTFVFFDMDRNGGAAVGRNEAAQGTVPLLSIQIGRASCRERV